MSNVQLIGLGMALRHVGRSPPARPRNLPIDPLPGASRVNTSPRKGHTMTRDLRLSSSLGTSFPVHAPDMLPAALDAAMGTVPAREAWEAANAAGSALLLEFRAAQNEWVASHSEADYASRDIWITGRDLACRPLENDVNAATRVSVEALRAYDAAQRAAFPAARSKFADAYLVADKAAREALAILDDALETRESLMTYLVTPERSARSGLGHFRNDSSLGTSVDQRAAHQRRLIATVVNVAPRLLVARLADAAKAAKV